jgi:hypothetical protein
VAFAFFEVMGAGGFVGGGVGGFVGAVGFGGGGVVGDAPPREMLAANAFVDVVEEGDAPPAAGAGGEAVGDLGGVLGLFDVAESLDLAEGDVEAETDGVVGLEGHNEHYRGGKGMG